MKTLFYLWVMSNTKTHTMFNQNASVFPRYIVDFNGLQSYNVVLEHNVSCSEIVACYATRKSAELVKAALEHVHEDKA